MDCKDVQPQIARYLHDLLIDSEHENVRQHLSQCAKCRKDALSLRSFSGEMKKLSSIEVPFSIEAEIFLSLSERGFGKGRKNAWGSQWVGLGIVLALGFLMGRISLPTSENLHLVDKAPDKAADENTKPYLEKLREIDQKLARIAADVPQTSKTEKPTIEFSPMHWDIQTNANSLERFWRIVPERGARSIWRTESEAVLEIPRNRFAEFLTWVQVQSYSVQGLPVSIEKIPDAEGNVPVSLVWESDLQISDKVVKHWHFIFLLQNSFLFPERMKAEGFPLLFDQHDFWVMEFSGRRYRDWLEVLKRFSGLQITLVEGLAEEVISPNAIVHISISHFDS